MTGYGALALALSIVLALFWKPAPIENQLLYLQLSERLPRYARELRNERLELQALFVDYADDPLLVGKARLAMLRYPEMAKPILEHYGSHPLFQAVLKDYGDNVIPPIHYFMTTDIGTIAVRHFAKGVADSVGQTWRRFWDDGVEATETPDATKREITPEDRGCRVAQCLRRCQDDHCTARPADASLPYR